MNVKQLTKEIALDVAHKVEQLGESEIYSHGTLTGDDYEVVFRYPISYDLQGEMIEEAESRLATALKNTGHEFWASFDDGPKYFQVVAVYDPY